MKSHIWLKTWILVLSVLMVCAACFGAAGETADSDFRIEGTTLVKYNGPGGEVTVPEGIEKLDAWAFEGRAVTKVNLPETLKEIESFCFFGCRQLTDITLPASLTNLEYDEEGIEHSQVFAYNRSLEAIHVAEGNPKYKSVDGVLFTADGKRLLYYPDGKNRGGKYAIPEGTEELGYSPFSAASLTAVYIPSTLKRFANYGNPFSAVDSLREINVSPDNRTYYSENGVLYSGNEMVCYPKEKAGTELKKEAFPDHVTRIGETAFSGNRNLKTAELPEGLEEVGWMSFISAEALKSVTIPASVNKISAYAFEYCPVLKQVTILNPDVELPDNSFLEEKYRDVNKYIIIQNSPQAVLYGYENSTTQAYAEKWGLKFESLGPAPGKTAEAVVAAEPEDAAENSSAGDAVQEGDFTIEGTTLVKYNGPGGEVTVPEGIEKLGKEAFAWTSVTKVNLPETLKEIDSYCFSQCRELSGITLPASLTNLEHDEKGINNAQVFAYNPLLKEIKVAEGNMNYKSVDGVLFTADGKQLLYFPDGKSGDYAIPEGTEIIGYTAFCKPNVASISIPASLRHVTGSDFSCFPALREISVSPDNRFLYSKDGILYDNSNTLIVYPHGKEKETLKPEDLAEGVREIANYAFEGNQRLKDIELPEGMTSLGYMSFRFAESLETVTVPSTVSYIGGYCFADCKNLKRVTILNPQTAIADNTQGKDPNEYNIFWDSSRDAVLCGYEGSSVQEYAETHGIGFESLGPAPGKAAEAVVEAAPVDTAEAEATIEPAAPAAEQDNGQADKSGNFVIEGTTLVRYFGNDSEVMVPNGVEVIGEWAFARCGMKKISFPETVKEIGKYCIFGCPELTEINLPASLETISRAQAIAWTPKLETINVAEGNPYYVSVDGVLFTADKTELLYYPGGKDIGGHYTIPDEVKRTGSASFDGNGLTSIDIPAGLPLNNGGADFTSCYNLKEINVSPDHTDYCSVDGLLLDKAGTTLILYPNGREAEMLKNGDLPAGVTAIGPFAFQHDEHLKDVEIPDGITRIDWMCFTWAKELKSVTLPASVNYISGYAFANCDNLEKVTILNPNAYIMDDNEDFSDEYRATMNFCIIDESPKAVICGYENSTAQAYAEKMGREFESLGPAPEGDYTTAENEAGYVPTCQR